MQQMEEITVSQPIPQQQIYIGMISSSASLQTPSSFQMNMTMPNCSKEPCIHFGVPPPDSNPIPFESINYNFQSNFEPNFQNSPYDDYDQGFSEDEIDFDYNL